VGAVNVADGATVRGDVAIKLPRVAEQLVCQLLVGTRGNSVESVVPDTHSYSHTDVGAPLHSLAHHITVWDAGVRFGFTCWLWVCAFIRCIYATVGALSTDLVAVS
jgi:hypothetical protein